MKSEKSEKSPHREQDRSGAGDGRNGDHPGDDNPERELSPDPAASGDAITPAPDLAPANTPIGTHPHAERPTLFQQLGNGIIVHPWSKLLGIVLGLLVCFAIHAAGAAREGDDASVTDLEQRIREQNDGLDTIETRLAALRAPADPAGDREILSQLEALVLRQRQLSREMQGELRAARSRLDDADAP